MRRGVALAALLLTAAACFGCAAADSYSAPQDVLERVYADKLTTEDAVKLGGYVAVDRFPPLTRNEIEVVLTVAGVQRRVSHLRRDNSWVFYNVPVGTHALDLHAAGYDMVTVRVDVLPSDLAQGATRRVRFSLAAQPERWLQQPLVLAPTAKVEYKEPVAGWSLRTLLSNPFYLMMGFMAISMWFIPKMMDSMDPEEKKLLQEQMAKNGGGLSGLLSAAMAGDPPQAVQQRKAAAARARLPSGPSGSTATTSSGGGGGGGGGGGVTSKAKPR